MAECLWKQYSTTNYYATRPVPAPETDLYFTQSAIVPAENLRERLLDTQPEDRFMCIDETQSQYITPNACIETQRTMIHVSDESKHRKPIHVLKPQQEQYAKSTYNMY